MSATVLIAVGTRHGSTREVARAVADTLQGAGLGVDVVDAADVDDLFGYDGVVLGGALYTGRWHADSRRFLRRHRRALGKLPVAVFAMGPRTLEPDDVRESRAQLDRSLATVPEVEPFAVGIFGGVISPERLGFPFNRMTRVDARDWKAIRYWADEVALGFCGKTAAGAVDDRTALQQTPR